jgi:hypothetical protein
LYAVFGKHNNFFFGNSNNSRFLCLFSQLGAAEKLATPMPKTKW